MFKTAFLEYHFLQSGYLKYIELFITPRHIVYNICSSQAYGMDPGPLPRQYLSLQSILVSAFHTMLQ